MSVQESRGTGEHHIKINKTNTAFFSHKWNLDSEKQDQNYR